VSRTRAPRQERRAGASGLAIAPSATALLAATTLSLAIAVLAGCGPPTSGKSALELYDEHCVRCHGADGHGDPRAIALAPNSDLSRSLLIQKRARGPIYLRITQGYGAMPGFSHKLERGDVELLVDYVLELDRPRE
jgi:mono/diheme cytochrome c family protein